MKNIHTDITTPQDETPDVKKEAVTENTAYSLLEEGLSQSPLTTDQKIAQLLDTQSKLTAEVRNLTNGLNQLFDFSKMLMKIQIESRESLENQLQTIIKSQTGMDAFLFAEKNNTQAKDVMRQLREFDLSKGQGRNDLYESRKLVIEKKDINIPAPDGWTLLENAVNSDAISLVELLLSSPDIQVTKRAIEKGAYGQTKHLFDSYLSKQKK